MSWTASRMWQTSAGVSTTRMTRVFSKASSRVASERRGCAQHLAALHSYLVERSNGLDIGVDEARLYDKAGSERCHTYHAAHYGQHGTKTGHLPYVDQGTVSWVVSVFDLKQSCETLTAVLHRVHSHALRRRPGEVIL